MKYNCNLCNYSTNDNSHYNRHLKTKKHIRKSVPPIPKKSDENDGQNKVIHASTVAPQNVPKRPKTGKIAYFCAFCQLQFTRSSSLTKHLTKCVHKLESDRITELESKLKDAKKEISSQKKEIDSHKVEKEYYKKLINNYSTLGPKTFNSITYVMHKYADAPHIKMIEPEKIECFQNINMKTVENMVSDYRNNRFVIFVINTIAGIHKKDNPEDQSIWSTDSSRYNYLIKELLENEGSYWTVDKKGNKSRDYLVEPILKFIRKEIVKYNELASEELMNDDLPKTRFSIITDTQRYGIDIIRDIDDGVLSAEIIRKMAKHFHHKKDLPLIEEIE